MCEEAAHERSNNVSTFTNLDDEWNIRTQTLLTLVLLAHILIVHRFVVYKSQNNLMNLRKGFVLAFASPEIA